MHPISLNDKTIKKENPTSLLKGKPESFCIIDNSFLSIKQRISSKYKDKINFTLIDNISSSSNDQTSNIIYRRVNNNDVLFYKREKDLVDKLCTKQNKDDLVEEKSNIINDFLIELQKLLGVKYPENLIENSNDISNEDLVKKLQDIYKIVHNKINDNNTGM